MSNGRAASQATVPISAKIRNRQNRTRQRILRESARLFIQKGFENVSVEEIIEAAEIARSSFYRFFSNREQVLANIIRPVFELGVRELEAIDSDDAERIMHGILQTYWDLWQASPDALRVSTRVGGVHFDLFRDIHDTYREKLTRLVERVEPSGILRNGSAEYTSRLIARSTVPVLEIYSNDPDLENLFYKTMKGLLLNPRKTS